jgi:glyoxylase-like metal-dependent hydrolase (beta-lactamase superfamily II)
MELEAVHAGGSTWYVPGPVNVGVFVAEGNRAVLVDSGGDESYGRKLFRLIEARGWTLEMIVNTHSHADHIGGNAYLQRKTRCRIAATKKEAVFIEDPLLEPAFLWGGFPFKALRNKFLQAQPSKVTDRLVPGESIPGFQLETVPLPGHFLEMIGVRTPDEVFFAADTVFSEKIIEKYGVTFCFDVGKAIETLENLLSIPAKLYVPAHAESVEDITALARLNLEALETVGETVAGLCSEKPRCFEEILEAVVNRWDLVLDVNQYVLVGSTLRAHLSRLSDLGRIKPDFDGGKMVWKALG